MGQLEIRQYGVKAHAFITNPIRDDARINILTGSVRSSKTWAMIPKVLALCGDGLDVPRGGLKVMVGASKDSVYDNVLRDLFEIIGPAAYHYNRQSGDLRLFGTPWKVLGANDERSERYVRGKTLAAAYVDEITVLPESFFRQLDFRLSVDNARLYGTTNPDSPFHWLFTGFIDNKEINEKGAGLVRTLHFTLEDNPTLSEVYKQSIRKAHSGVFYQRFVEGKWVLAEGLIFRDCWHDLENTFEDADMPPGLLVNYMARYIGVDCGAVNPQVYLDILDDGNVLWVIREYYHDSKKEQCQKSDSQYGDDLEEFVGEYKQDCQVIIDPSAESFSLECRNRGWLVLDADNSVFGGLRRLDEMFSRRLVRIHRRNCPNLLRERATYVWNPKKTDKGKEEPLKKNDHCIDTLRYVAKTVIQPYRLLAAA
jgi:PBSX family phage terminase large subunit